MPLAIPARTPRPRDVLASRSAIEARSVDEAHEVISSLFRPHELTPLDRGVHMSLRSAHVGPVGLDLLDYDRGVRISPAGLERFHLVQIPLRGHARMRVGAHVVESSPRQATVPPLDDDFVLEWREGTPHLIVYIDRAEVVRIAAALWNLDDASRLQLAPSLSLDTPAGQAFLRSVLELHDLVDMGTPAHADLSRRLASELMITRLLLAVDNSIERSLESWAPSTRAGTDDGLYRRFAEVAEQTPTHALTPAEVARRVGVPLRTMQQRVQQASGSTPTVLLREMRFRRAHERLREADSAHTTVTAVAEECGFGHLGRFAGEYRLRFGEGPAETLRR